MKLRIVIYMALAAGIVFAAWWGGWTPATGLDWRVRNGDLEEQYGEYLAVTDTTLDRAGSSVLLRAGGRVRRGEPGALPSLLGGEMELTSEDPWQVDGKELAPADGSMTVKITTQTISVVKGVVSYDGKRYDPGSTILVGPPIVVPPPKTARPRPTPTRTVGASRARIQVIDAGDGTPIPDCFVTLTFSHFDDGYPPLPVSGSRSVVATNEDGFFDVPRFRPDDPRVKLHLEVVHPDYLPRIDVVERPRDIAGRWQFTTVRLRRSTTYAIEVLGPDGLPLVDAAVAEWPSEFGGDFFLGEDLWEDGRTVRTDRPTIRYTDENGILIVGPYAVARYLMHEDIYVWDIRLQNPAATLVIEPPRWPPRDGEVPRVFTRRAPSRTYALEDLDRVPLANMLIEVHLDQMAPVRLYTDEFGAFLFGPRPFPRTEPPLSFRNPRRGTVTVLSPLMWKVRRRVTMPSPDTSLIVEAHVGGELTFRVVERNADDDLVPFPANQVRLDHDMTLVRRSANGEVLYQGGLPLSGSTIVVDAVGHLPTSVPIPAAIKENRFIDLGDVELDPGEKVRVRLTGGTPEEYERSRLLIASELDPETVHGYEFDAKGVIDVGGIVVRRRYRTAVEGSRIATVDGEFVAFDEVLTEGLDIPVTRSRETECRLHGSTTVAPFSDAYQYRVVERYYTEEDDLPFTYASYPLPPDGRFGSVRTMEPAVRAEVFIHGPRLYSAYAVTDPIFGRCEFDFGPLELMPSRTARFRFVAEGLGTVSVPRQLTLFGEVNDNHEVAAAYRVGTDLLLANLRPGQYVLRFPGEDGREDAHVFHLGTRTQKIEDVIVRAPNELETIELRLVDAKRKFVDGARVTNVTLREGAVSPPLVSLPGLPLPELTERLGEVFEDGRYTVEISTLVENRIDIEAPGFVTARATLPQGVGFDRPVTLVKPASVSGQVRDANGLIFTGDLEVTFRNILPPKRSEKGVVVEHGEPFVFRVAQGRFEGVPFPPGMHRFAFRHADSEAKTDLELSFFDGVRAEIPLIQLEDGRSLRGIVELPSGEPAANAVVALVPPERAFRFPQRQTDLLKQRYSTRADSLGQYSIDGLPLDLTEDLTLVARLPGYNDAFETPVDLTILEHPLYLLRETELVLDLAYGDRRMHPDFEFRLRYFNRFEDDWVDLGPVAIPPGGFDEYRGVTEGLYELSWGLRTGHPDVPPRFVSAEIFPAQQRILRLHINDSFVSGTAFFNGERLERGWIIYTEDPNDPDATRIGRITDGAYEIGVSSLLVFGSLIPDRRPLPHFSVFRGEALPLERSSSLVRNRANDFSYEAYDLTILFDEDLLEEHPNLRIEFPHYELIAGRYKVRRVSEPVNTARFRLSLLQPGPFTFKVIARGAFTRTRTVEMDADKTVRFTR